MLFGCGGSALVEVHKWFVNREKVHAPHYAKKLRYWLGTIGMVIGAGFLVCAHQLTIGHALAPWLAVNIGASAPAVVLTLKRQQQPLVD